MVRKINDVSDPASTKYRTKKNIITFANFSYFYNAFILEKVWDLIKTNLSYQGLFLPEKLEKLLININLILRIDLHPPD